MSLNLDFLVIGSQRCATSYVHSVFENEKVTNVPKKKELNFFSHHIYKKNLSWYFSNFEEEGSLTGEVCPSYFLMRPSEIRYLKELYPDLKIVLILRDPVKRLWSSIHRHWTYSYLEDTEEVGTDFISLLKFIKKPTNLYFGRYSYTIKKWKRVFGEDQIKILFYEDMKTNPDKFMSELYLFLNIRSKPFIDQKRKNTSKVKGEVDKNINYIIYKTHKKEIEDLISLGYQNAKSWKVKYENNFEAQKISLPIKVVALGLNCLKCYVYDPVNVLIDLHKSHKIRKLKNSRNT